MYWTYGMVGSKEVTLVINLKKPLDRGKWLFKERLKVIMRLAQQLLLQVAARPE